jgi:serine/threonine-protein kinase
VAAAVAKALEKLPADRFESARAFAEALVSPAFTTVVASAVARHAARPARGSKVLLACFAATAVLGVAVAAWAPTRPESQSAAGLMRLEIIPEGSHRLAGARQPLAISPDGRTIAVNVRGPDGARVYVRRVDELAMRQVEGTEGASNIAFLADGNWLAFIRGTALFKVPLAGGRPTRVLDVPGINRPSRGGKTVQSGSAAAPALGCIGLPARALHPSA